MTVEFPAMSLARYANRIGYRDCAFFGVDHPGNIAYACCEIWTLQQRNDIEHALLQAQSQIEAAIGYPLRRRWITDERHRAADLIQARQGHVIAGGVMADARIGNSVAVDYATDPAVVTLAGVTCALENIHIFHEDIDQEIEPTAKAIVAGILTARIPWCRLVAPAYQDNPELGWDYADVATWGAGNVDIRCITNNTATQAALYREGCDNCTIEVGTGCILVRDGRLGQLRVRAESSSCCGFGCTWDWAEINYYAGLMEPTRLSEDAIVRLAHANMATEPCGCAVTQRLWQRDRNTPEVLTRERENCPFGMSDGAWIAWRFAQSERLVRGRLLS